jgi:hypothetical protein
MKAKKILDKAINVFFAFLLGVTTIGIGVFSPIPKAKVNAETVNVVDFAATSIESDLADLDYEKFPKNENGKESVARFTEFCYSQQEDLSQYFALFLYVYNPTETNVPSKGHTVNMAVKYNKQGEPIRYNNVGLDLIDKTENNRFFKFKINISENTLGQTIAYAADHNGERRYDIAGIQLAKFGIQVSTTDSKIAQTFYFTGYAAGCGADSNAESTLTSRSETLDTLTLEVHPTVYRPEGNNGKNEYTQDSLHSVYFSVPNSYIEKYGEMVAVHATWLNAVLAPALVTGNQDAYAAILPFLGVDIGGFTEDLEYAYAVNYKQENHGQGSHSYYADLDYNLPNMIGGDAVYSTTLRALYMIFNSGGSENSADNYTVQSEDIYTQLKESAKKYGGQLVNGKFAACLFESVDSQFTDINIHCDDEFELTSEVIGNSWWDKLWGNTTTTTFDGIKAIQAVSNNDLTFDKETDCNNLYISAQDYTNFIDYFNANKADSTVYLFRYQVSEYIAREAELFEIKDTLLSGYKANSVDTNAYFFQETVNLDFDIIDVTFSVGGEETVIPVTCNPIDIVHGATPPLDTTPDIEWPSLDIEWPSLGSAASSCANTLGTILDVIYSFIAIIVVIFVGVAIFRFVKWIVKQVKK